VQEVLRLRRTRKRRNGIAPARPEIIRGIHGRGMLLRSQLHVWRVGKPACLLPVGAAVFLWMPSIPRNFPAFQ
jgi:hypothetical protein